jgi:hypothetical protein
MHASEPSVPDPSRFEVEIPTAKLKKYKLPGIDQILAQLIQAGSETLWSEIHRVINSTWNKEEFLDQWKVSIIVSICKKGDKTECSNFRGTLLLLTSYKMVSSILLLRLSLYVGYPQCMFRHNRVFAFIRYWRKNRCTMRQYICYS